MTRALNPRQLTGQDDTHLITLPDGHRLQPEVASAFAALQADARQAGFELGIGRVQQLGGSARRIFGAQTELHDTGGQLRGQRAQRIGAASI